jgi:hypothetical protein
VWSERVHPPLPGTAAVRATASVCEETWARHGVMGARCDGFDSQAVACLICALRATPRASRLACEPAAPPTFAAMEVQIFGTKKSADTRKALRFFAERRIRTHFVDLAERAASKGELTRFAQKFGVHGLVDRAPPVRRSRPGARLAERPALAREAGGRATAAAAAARPLGQSDHSGRARSRVEGVGRALR